MVGAVRYVVVIDQEWWEILLLVLTGLATASAAAFAALSLRSTASLVKVEQERRADEREAARVAAVTAAFIYLADTRTVLRITNVGPAEAFHVRLIHENPLQDYDPLNAHVPPTTMAAGTTVDLPFKGIRGVDRRFHITWCDDRPTSPHRLNIAPESVTLS